MTSFRLLKPGITSTIIILLMTLQISSCSTEEFADSVANNIISDTPNISSDTSGTTTNTTNTSGIFNPAVAMYSYNANLSDAQPLSGAVLEQTTVYLFFNNTSQYSSMNFYCCKGIDGASTGEAHNAPASDSSAPFVYSVDLSQYSTSGTRELYVDATRADGSGLDSINVSFSINITIIPTVSDVNLSWVAPVQREDNNPITPYEIASYKIYYGTTKGSYTKSIYVDGSIDSYTVRDIAEGTYYFALTTTDIDGRESKYSSEVTIIVS